METQKFMGKGQLVKRLIAQVGSKNLAVNILKKRGDLKSDGKTLTAKGLKRNSMNASERAKDRASKKTGLPSSRFSYNKKTNNVKKIKSKTKK
jgi:hypothetical protein